MRLLLFANGMTRTLDTFVYGATPWRPQTGLPPCVQLSFGAVCLSEQIIIECRTSALNWRVLKSATPQSQL